MAIVDHHDADPVGGAELVDPGLYSRLPIATYQVFSAETDSVELSSLIKDVALT